MNKGSGGGVSPGDEVPQPGLQSSRIWERGSRYLSPGGSLVSSYTRLVIRDGEGVFVRDVDGNEYLDLTSASYCTSTGHRHPKVIAAIKAELDKIIHWYDLMTPTKADFLEALNEITPAQIDAFQMYTGGSETVEAAMRLAQSYTGKDEFISLHRSFHGKTWGARSISDTPVRKAFGPIAPGVYRTLNPYCYRCPLGLNYPSCGAACADIINDVYEQETRGRVAAVILEPIQGNDTIVLPPEFMAKIEEFCRRHGILLVCDEILAGMGRSGHWWSHQLTGARPDIITIGKGIASGFPLGILASSGEIMSTGPFAQPVHSSTTYGGNTVAAAAALATIKVYLEEELLANVRRAGAHLKQRLLAMKERYEVIGDVRGEGLLVGIEFVQDRDSKERINEHQTSVLFNGLLKRGVLVAAKTNVLCLAPPLVITEVQLDRGLDIIEAAIGDLQDAVSKG